MDIEMDIFKNWVSPTFALPALCTVCEVVAPCEGSAGYQHAMATYDWNDRIWVYAENGHPRLRFAPKYWRISRTNFIANGDYVIDGKPKPSA